MTRKDRKPVRKRRSRIKIKRQRGKSEKHTRRRIKIRRPRKQQRAPQNKSRSLRNSNIPTDPRVARALGLMRREGVSASMAARREGMKLDAFRKGAGRFVYRSGPGKPWKVRNEDRLSFSMEVLTRQGRVSAITRDSHERKLLHEYELVLRMFRGAEDGAEEELKRFKGKTVGGYELITDPKLLIQLEEADEIDVENFYSPVRGRS